MLNACSENYFEEQSLCAMSRLGIEHRATFDADEARSLGVFRGDWSPRLVDTCQHGWLQVCRQATRRRCRIHLASAAL